MSMRKQFWLIAALVLALVVTACGGKKEPVPAAKASAAEQAAQPGGNLAAGDAAAGKTLFATTCAACHGPEGKGVTGLGKDMTHSEFIAEKTDAELLEFLQVGRAPDDPLNTTGVLMPPRGGNPSFTDEQLMDIVAFVRSIHE